MALTTNTMATAAFKKALGFANTDTSKSVGNEQYRTGFSAALSQIFDDVVPSNPSMAALYGITGGSVEYVRLTMVPDLTSNGHAYFACLPADYQANTSNPNKALAQFANNTRLLDTAGVVQIVPASFDLNYNVIPYSGGTSAKGSGTVIAPADARDWYLDPYNGVFYQQGSGSDSVVNYIECFVWVGGFLTDRLSVLNSGSFTNVSTVITNSSQYSVVDSQTAVTDPNFTVASWYVTAMYNDQAYVTQVEALLRNGVVKYNEYSKINIGTQLFQVKCAVSNTNVIQLLVKPTVATLTVVAKRLAVY